jgi:hypothetical protein
MSDYEKLRAAKIARNKAILESLGLGVSDLVAFCRTSLGAACRRCAAKIFHKLLLAVGSEIGAYGGARGRCSAAQVQEAQVVSGA